MATPLGLTPFRFRLIPFRSPLLRESLLLSFPWATEMFQFAQFPLPALCIQTGVTPHDGCRVSPFGHPRIEAWSAAPRGFSQPPTSFIGSTCQGIHRWLFVAWKSTKMLVLAMQFSISSDAPRCGDRNARSAGGDRRSRRLSRSCGEQHSLKAEERTVRSPTRVEGGSRRTLLPHLASSGRPTSDQLGVSLVSPAGCRFLQHVETP